MAGNIYQLYRKRLPFAKVAKNKWNYMVVIWSQLYICLHGLSKQGKRLSVLPQGLACHFDIWEVTSLIPGSTGVYCTQKQFSALLCLLIFAFTSIVFMFWRYSTSQSERKIRNNRSKQILDYATKDYCLTNLESELGENQSLEMILKH